MITETAVPLSGTAILSRVPERLPNFVIVGAPRSGTTTLASYLGEHPEVYIPPTKEVRFFNRHWERGIDWYRSQFQVTPESRRVGEATPMYMHDAVAMRRLDRTLPDADLVAILRSPLERAVSHFHYRVVRGLEDRDFSAAIEEETTGAPGVFPYLAIGRYYRQMRKVVSLGDRHRLLVLWFEDLARDPGGVLASAAQFLGVVPMSELIDGRVVNSADRFRSITLRNAAKRAPALVQAAVGRLNRLSTDYPVPPEATQRTALEFLEDDILALQAHTGRDLTSWVTPYR